jgi:vacuolar protein sorting-associated protein 13A/C
MFEGLLERLLLSYFGKFIDGVDKNRISLGVISGNLIIEDVSIKREAIDELELPIKITYSSIQRLQLIVPWRTLSS